jgi:1-acyl-sn-glycerol-3-phosphate acyltransferase
MKSVIGWLAFFGYFINTILWVTPIVLLALLKLIPIVPLQKVLSYLIDGCAGCWVQLNTLNQQLLSPLKIEIIDMPELSTRQWYMVISNHQSWVDILVLQRIFSQKIPFLKFFLKQQLIFVPVIGLAWWALDFPFMKRYSREFLAKNPHLKGKDVEATRKACQKFKHKPVSVMNFVEGTRFTPAKWQKQQSPHSNLLLPRAGGLSFAINAMSESIDTILDVTICYPDGTPTYWQLMCGDVKRVRIKVASEQITEALIGDYQDDPEFKTKFQFWLNDLWQRKQKTLEQLKKAQ